MNPRFVLVASLLVLGIAAGAFPVVGTASAADCAQIDVNGQPVDPCSLVYATLCNAVHKELQCVPIM